MFARWLEEYQRLSQKPRFLSQLAAFLISIFSFLSLYDLVGFFNEYPEYLSSLIEEGTFLPSLTFQISILIIFAAKFVLMCFKAKKVFWLNQVLWIFGITLLAVYWFVSRPPELPFRIYSMYEGVFNQASKSFDFFGGYYLILSPLHRILILIIATVKVCMKKEM